MGLREYYEDNQKLKSESNRLRRNKIDIKRLDKRFIPC